MRTAFCVAFTILLSISTLGKTLELPIIKAVGPLVITQLKIDGKDYKFLLDTGSNANFIEPSSGKNFRKILTRKPEKDTYVNTFAGKQKSEAYTIDLKLGDFLYKDMLSYAMSTNKFNEEQDGINCCDGILGIDFLKKYPVEVNIKNKVITIHKEFKLKGKWKRLPIIMKGKNVITFECSLDNHKFSFRLDSGSEVPVIFHTHEVDKLLLREQMFSQGYHGGGLPFFNLNNLKCGELVIPKLSSTYFYGSKGALSHKFIDGNVGAHLLGDRYILDLKNNAIWVRNKPLDFKVPGKSFEYDTKFNFVKGHRSIINQAVALTINSCAENSQFQDCMSKLCEIEGKKLCVFKETRRNFDDFVGYMFPVQTRDCSIARLVSELRYKPVQYNFCWYKLSEVNQNFYAKKFDKISLKGILNKYTNNITALKVTNPVKLTRDFYCYAISQGIVSMSSLPAPLFGLSVKGLSLSNKKLDSYRKWLSSSNGLACQRAVEETVGQKVDGNLEKYFSSSHLILINPYTILGDGSRHYKENWQRSLNHELLHAIYSLSPEAKSLAKKGWDGLSAKAKGEFKNSHKDYNFNNESILLREYFSYTYENKLDGLSFLK